MRICQGWKRGEANLRGMKEWMNKEEGEEEE
jgi:hypothetical protein